MISIEGHKNHLSFHASMILNNVGDGDWRLFGGGSGNGVLSLHDVDGASARVDDGDADKLQRRQQRRSSIGGILQRPQEEQQREKQHGPWSRERQQRWSSMDIMLNSYNPAAVAAAMNRVVADASGDQSSADGHGIMREKSLSGLCHFENIMAALGAEGGQQQQQQQQNLVSFPTLASTATKSPSPRRRCRSPTFSVLDEQQQNMRAERRQSPPPELQDHQEQQSQQRAHSVTKEILNDDAAWQTLKSEIRRTRLVTSLGVADVCRSYISSERWGEQVAAERESRRRRVTMDMVAGSSNVKAADPVNLAVAAAPSAKTAVPPPKKEASSEDLCQGVGGRVRRRFSLF